ncbi:putative gnat family [Diplodia seriata]|uniref:Putative gnat family n=1 Tax=Diplodia seriata TaxID=420778 RepID=A0A0G2EHA8_9PEZI|nr:putative gnat family [Diplodia seriata]
MQLSHKRLVDIYFAAFSRNAFGSAVFPDAPAVRQWWIDTLSRELQHQKGVAMYNLVEYADGTDTPVFANEQKHKNIVAFAKWLRPMEEGPDSTEAAIEIQTEEPLPAGCDQELFTRYFAELNRRHKACMGTRAHWYLELLATHPSHQRRGAASALVNHVLGSDDYGNPANVNANYDAYLEASPEGLSTYRRLGFEKRDGFNVEIEGKPYETLMMVRPAAGKREKTGNGEQEKEKT